MCVINDGSCSRRATGIARLVVPLLIVSGCSPERQFAPTDAGNSAISQYGTMAFSATVTPRAQSVSIAPPSSTGTASTRFHGDAQNVNLSLLGSDVVRLVPANVRVSALGAFSPNRVRVTFDVTIENRLPSLALIAATWPTPPTPAVILFPLDYAVTSAPGGVTGGSGNSIAVSLPGGGSVVPSDNWNGTGAAGSGAPYGFFSSVPCPSSVTIDCFRWVSFGARVEPMGPRPTRTVGFDIDPSVGQFRARLIVASDLVPAPITQP